METKQLVTEYEQDSKETLTLGAGEMSDEVYRIVEATAIHNGSWRTCAGYHGCSNRKRVTLIYSPDKYRL